MKTRVNTAKWNEKRQLWYVHVQRDGERRTFYSSTKGREGQREANRKADAWLNGGAIADKRKVNDAMAEWLETLKPTRQYESSANHRQYESCARNHILPIIGNRRIGDLTEGDVQKVIDKVESKGLAAKSVRNIRGCMSAFLKYCRMNKLTTLRIDDVTISKDLPKGEKRTLQPNELKTLFSVDTYERYGKRELCPFIHLYRFYALTGARVGEMLPRFKNDVKDGVLTITSAINFKDELTRGKNENARRTITLGELALNVLDDQRKMEQQLGITSMYLFPDVDNGYIPQWRLYAQWKLYCKSNGIDPVSVYELRHTFISVCKTKLSTEQLKSVVGHSANMDTTGIYGHEVDGEAQETAMLIDQSFGRFTGTK